MTEKLDSKSAEDILKKYDKESDTMMYKGVMAKIVSAIAITFSIFQLYTATFGVLDAQLQRAVHLGFGLALVYLLYPTRKSWSRYKVHPFDVLLSILGAAAPAYIVFEYQHLVLRSGTVSGVDLAVGLLGILLVIEATRRIVGLPMVCVVLAFLIYAFAGPYMPGVLAHRGLTIEQLVGHLYFTTEGIFGIPLGVSSTFIFLFILFGAYLESTGLGKFFIDLANAIAGWASGGPAKVAVLSSGLMGTVSGSSVANVVGTGSLTIPMMKKLGYHKDFAGAVEAAASTGGQLMPPVMGAAAFPTSTSSRRPSCRPSSTSPASGSASTSKRSAATSKASRAASCRRSAQSSRSAAIWPCRSSSSSTCSYPATRRCARRSSPSSCPSSARLCASPRA